MLTYRREMSEVYESLDAGVGQIEKEGAVSEVSFTIYQLVLCVGDTFETALFWHAEK